MELKYNNSPIKCTKGLLAVQYCRHLQCDADILLCQDEKCVCHENHKKCLSHLRKPISNLLQTIESYQNLKNRFDIVSNLGQILSFYQSLEKKIQNQKQQVIQIKNLFTHADSTYQGLKSVLIKNFRARAKQVIEVQKSIQISQICGQNLKLLINTISSTAQDVLQKVSDVSNILKPLYALKSIESEQNHQTKISVRTYFQFQQFNENGILYPRIECCSRGEDRYQLHYQRTVISWKQNQRVKLIKDEIEKKLQTYNYLTSIDLYKNKIRDQHVSSLLKNRGNLQNINVNNNRLSSEGISGICQIHPHLKILSCQENMYNPDQDSDQDNSRYHGSGCQRIDDQAMKSIATLEKLQQLNISRNSITFIGVQYLCKGKFEYLIFLNISSNDIGNQGALLIGLNFPRLQNLNISDCSIGDAGIVGISQGIRNLKVLKAENNQITDEGVRSICTHQKLLVALELQNQRYSKRKNIITSKGIQQISLNLKLLQKLSLDQPLNKQSKHPICIGEIFYLSKLRNLQSIDHLNTSINFQKGKFKLFKNLRKYPIEARGNQRSGRSKNYIRKSFCQRNLRFIYRQNPKLN